MTIMHDQVVVNGEVIVNVFVFELIAAGAILVAGEPNRGCLHAKK